MSFRAIAKLGLLLVLIGFFMPVACGNNGFEIAEKMMKVNKTVPGILTYLVFISALIGVIIGVLIIFRKISVGSNIDLAVIIVCIASGLIVYFGSLENNVKLQNGAYVILAGWIVALACQVLSIMKRE
jgi:succinate dehydrogenase hydrophobic anchor subunit